MARQTGARTRALVIISTIAVLLVLLLASAVQATGKSQPTTAIYTVRSGDTLWEIATNRGSDGGDVRGTIDAIRRINDLDGATIHPGQVLDIPVG